MKSTRAKNEDWGFFETVARAAFLNPFGETRDDLDRVIGGAPPEAAAEEVLHAVVSRIGERIDDMRRNGSADLRRHEGARREILRDVFLFHLFHRRMDAFDSLIQTQLKAGDTPVKVPFARELLQELAAFGFSAKDSERFLAVFYQLRRAFYFIRNGLVGNSPSMRGLRKELWDCVFTHDMRWFESHLWDRMEDFSILLLGETGTGKGAAAAAIGRSGFIPFEVAKNSFAESFTRNFVAINLSQFSEGVLESELFGHKKGAFTGAVENHEGLFSRCAPHGVIFLDEIGDVSTPVQIKLLQVVQERVFFPVGSHEARRFSGRVIAATNRPLDEYLNTGKFREDLFYRLCSNIIMIPPLRQRLKEDPRELDNLLDSILSRIAGDGFDGERQTVKKILKQDAGTEYQWHGNVRELEQAVKRVILTGHYRTRIFAGKSEEPDDLVRGIKEGAFTAEELMARYCRALYQEVGTYEEVARRTQLDRRTVKKYVLLS